MGPAGTTWLCTACISQLQNPDLKYVPPDHEAPRPTPQTDPRELVISNTIEQLPQEGESEVPGLPQTTRTPNENSIASDTFPPASVTYYTQLPACELYKKGICPHGVSGKRIINGTRCQFSHPKKCKFFCRHGPNSPQTCRQGSRCRFLHPVICPDSLHKYECYNNDCKLTHLKTTKRLPRQEWPDLSTQTSRTQQSRLNQSANTHLNFNSTRTSQTQLSRVNHVNTPLTSAWNNAPLQNHERSLANQNQCDIENNSSTHFLFKELAAMFKEEFSNLAQQLQNIKFTVPQLDQQAEISSPSQPEPLHLTTPPMPQPQGPPLAVPTMQMNHVPLHYYPMPSNTTVPSYCF